MQQNMMVEQIESVKRRVWTPMTPKLRISRIQKEDPEILNIMRPLQYNVQQDQVRFSREIFSFSD